MTTHAPTSIMVRQTAAQMVAAYNAALEKARQAYGLIAEANTLIKDAFGPYAGEFINRNESWYNNDPDDYLKRVKKTIKRSAWARIVEITEIRKMMSEKRSEEFRKMLDSDGLPELTIEAILTELDSFMQNQDALRAEMVKEVFAMLRPRGSYVTNSPFSVGKKVILSGYCEHTYGGQFRVSYYRQTELLQLDKCFHMLDGKGLPEGYRSRLEDAINTSGYEGRGETEYFRFKCCANRNLHLEFKRLDLVAVLNQIAGGEAVLRDPSRKTREGVR